MTERYFVDAPLQGGDVCLAGPEAHHLLRVMRAQVGDRVVVFDGQGREATAEVVECGRREARLQIEEVREISREPLRAVTLGVALPRGERQRWLVEKAVELGVAALTPLITQRGVARPTERSLERLRRVVVEASKQCGRNQLMRIGRPQAATEFWLAAPPGAARAVAEAAGHLDPAACFADSPTEAWLAVGPEGGFATAELEAARRAGWQAVSLGPRTLRVETAAVALAVLACR